MSIELINKTGDAFLDCFTNDDITMRHLMLLLLHRLLLIGCIHLTTTTTSSFRTISTTRSRSTLPSRITAKANGDAEAEAEDANNTTNSNTICILGGSGRIGSAVAIHLLQRDPTCTIILVGRRQSQIDAAVEEVLAETTTTRQTDQKDTRVTGHRLESVWDATSDGYQALVDTADCIIHTAGPYLEEQPVPLQMALRSHKCRAYVDVSDPLPYLEQSLLLSDMAKHNNITALVAAGAFPGMSNVFAVEAAQTLSTRIQDVRFQYFTAGLGGSGAINLYITNLGFGEPMVQYDAGKLRWFLELSGSLLGKVDFFLPSSASSASTGSSSSSTVVEKGNKRAKKRIGTQTVFAWPFPEAATVAKHLNIRGNSYAAMGTAPDLWNTMLGILVNLVPRNLWKNPQFSKFLADFSQPLVAISDAVLDRTSGGNGETHCMRIDVTPIPAHQQKDDDDNDKVVTGVSIIQGHDSFRRCVGQSCAEFALDALRNNDSNKHGVYLPEQFYNDAKDRSRIIPKLTSTPGTFCYTGPISLTKENGGPPKMPTTLHQALAEANKKENAGISE